MAVVVEDPLGWVLDEEQWYNQCYEDIGHRVIPALYRITEPFRMDSEVDALNRRIHRSGDASTSEVHKSTTVDDKHRKKRRRRSSSSDRDELDKTLCEDCQKLVDVGHQLGYFDSADSGRVLTNNRESKEAAKNAERAAAFPDIRQEHNTESTVTGVESDCVQLCDHCDYGTAAMVGTVCVNGLSHSITIGLNNQYSYFIPANCRFFWGDVNEGLQRLLRHGHSQYFDLILMDPPWRNKAVKRQKTYSTRDKSDFEELPIRDLLKSGGLVGIWVTNNTEYVDFVIDTLLPRWGLVYEARWFWMKVTKLSEAVCEYRSFKKPYESIVFGRRPTLDMDKKWKVPDKKLITSIPCALPSRKPPLLDVLKGLGLAESASCLELYARYLLPGVVSIGDEVIKFQCQTYFEKVQKDG